MNAFVLFGATGSLVKEKIFPALTKNILPNDFKIITYTRKEIFPKPTIENYIEVNGAFSDPKKLLEILENEDIKKAYFYAALPPQIYKEIITFVFDNFQKFEPKLALEKPFGDSLSEAQKLASFVKKYNPNSFYLIDHYLAKEVLIKIKKGDTKIERDNISKIEIAALESDDVSHRGKFYDKVGAILDVGQNHLLNTLDLFINIEDVDYKQGTLKIGQYEGYVQTEGVESNSTTETFFEAKLTSDEKEIILKTGKALNEKKVYVKINFKDNSEVLIDIKDEGKHPYEYIISDFVNNKKEYSLKLDKALRAWKITEEILNDRNKTNLFTYKKGWNLIDG